MSIMQGIDVAFAAGDLAALTKWSSMALTLSTFSTPSSSAAQMYILLKKVAKANIDTLAIQHAGETNDFFTNNTDTNDHFTNDNFAKATLALQRGIDAATAASDYATLREFAPLVDALSGLPILVPSSRDATNALKSKLPVDCVVSAWSAWSNCTQQGSMAQTRSIATPASNGGNACPPLSQSSNCPVPCAVSPWSSFRACSQECGGGTQNQSRTVVSPALFGGTSCPVLTNIQACNSNVCPVDCVVGQWSSWSACDSNGIVTQTRPVLTAAANGGTACPSIKNSSNCPVPCQVSEWSPFSTCSQPCGGGTQSQTRTATIGPLYGGTSCPTLSNSRECNVLPCSTNCITGAWSSWSTCSNGVTRRTMPIVKEATYGGTACPSIDQLSQSSNCPVDCLVGPWSSWSSCSNGTMTHTRSILTSPAYGGQVCPPLTEGSNCPVDCRVSSWSTCSKTCGGGTQTRTIVQPAINGGLTCPDLSQPCNAQACPVNCVGSWSGWSACSSNCGGGKQTQTYTINIPSVYGGTECPSTNGAVNTQTCNTQACPVNCVGSWSSFGSCSSNCGGGTQTQTYVVSTPAANGGTACAVANNATNSQTCNSQACNGQIAYLTPGTYTWVCPTGVTSVCAVAIGGGSSGCYYTGGSGGGLSFRNNIVVVPGQSYSVVVGAGGTGSGWTAASGNNSAVLGLTAGGGGGNGGTPGTPTTGGNGGIGGNGGGNGGGGIYNVGTVGGSGAGGYTSNGGVGSFIGTHGCGNGGGGVGIFGGSVGGSGGTAGSRDQIDRGPYGSGGSGGSGGATGSVASNWMNPGAGGLYGGGGGSGNGQPGYTASYGGGGAVRIIWGPNRAFPNNNTNDL